MRIGKMVQFIKIGVNVSSLIDEQVGMTMLKLPQRENLHAIGGSQSCDITQSTGCTRVIFDIARGAVFTWPDLSWMKAAEFL